MKTKTGCKDVHCLRTGPNKHSNKISIFINYKRKFLDQFSNCQHLRKNPETPLFVWKLIKPTILVPNSNSSGSVGLQQQICHDHLTRMRSFGVSTRRITYSNSKLKFVNLKLLLLILRFADTTSSSLFKEQINVSEHCSSLWRISSCQCVF
jgi:hypothetical protein